MLICLLAILVMLPSGQTFAQQIISLNRWKISNYGSGPNSEITASAIVLRQYSPVFVDNIAEDVPEITISCKWVNPLNYVDIDVRLTLTYQNGAYEIIERKIPTGVGTEQTLKFKPKNSAGHKVVKIEFEHVSTAMEVKIYSVEITGTFMIP